MCVRFHFVGWMYLDDDLGAEAGAVYVYRFNGATGLYEELQKVKASDGAKDDRFGSALDVYGNTLVLLIAAERENNIGRRIWPLATFVIMFSMENAV